MSKLDPWSVLPPMMRKHVFVPYWFLPLALVPLFLYGNFLIAQGRGQAWSAKAGATDGVAVTRRLAVDVGERFFSIEMLDGGGHRFTGDGLAGLKLARQPDGDVVLQDDAGGVVHRLKLKDGGDKGRLYDGAGQLVYKIKEEDADGKLKVRDAAGKPLFAVKVKEDGFSLYDERGERFAKGKAKDGEYVVRSIPANHTIGTIRGPYGLDEAALLAVPLPAPYSVLLWLGFSGS